MKDVIISREKIISIRKALKVLHKKIVFTNGCFDILHAGHVDYLAKAKEKGSTPGGTTILSTAEAIRKLVLRPTPTLHYKDLQPPKTL